MESSETKSPDPGVFLVKADKVSIPNFSITIDKKGNVTASPVELHTGIDMSPYWLNIGYEHVMAAENAHNGLMLAKDAKNDKLIGEYLRKESSAGMQAIMASGIAIDAHYASIKEYVRITKSTIDAWRSNGTARYLQIAEVMRVGFHLSNDSAKQLNYLRQSRRLIG
jgi:hypothetical protein